MSSPETEPTVPADDLVEGAAASVEAAPTLDEGAAADGTTERDAAEPDGADPDAAEPDTAEPDTAEPDTAEPDTAEPDTAEPLDALTEADGQGLLSGLPPLAVPEQVEPVRRRRGRRGAAAEATSSDQPPMPSLTSPLLSGRSLEPTRPKRRFELLRDHPRWLIGAVVVVLVVAGLVAGKLFAERAADSAMETRAAELEELLGDATPEEFLAFSSGVEEPGSIAERTRNLDGFVNVKATADQSFIRFQPSGWWAGFTERCLVAVVRAEEVSITVPKTACIRVEAPPS